IVSTLNLIEIYPVRNSWTPVADFISSLPFCIAQTTDRILAVEMANYPNEVELPVSFRSWDYEWTPEIQPKHGLEANMQGKIAGFAREWQREEVESWQALIDNKRTFPPEQNGKYSDSQRWLFLQKNVLMFALMENRRLVNKWLDAGNEIKIERFKSYYIITLAVFLEYYVQGKVGKASDVGDFYHLSYAPYVDLGVFDNERNDLLRKISRMATPLGKMRSYNLKQFIDIVRQNTQSLRT
ncbi:MAG TPA: hypothetical protein VMT34_14460, partial [Aggregatilineales bacterium]|nr:hypothetical protein [Aggregatilineales bacterium]